MPYPAPQIPAKEAYHIMEKVWVEPDISFLCVGNIFVLKVMQSCKAVLIAVVQQ